MTKLSEKQIESVKKIYDACVETINHFLYIENVKNMIRRKTANSKLSASDVAYEINNRLFLVLDQEYFYLRNHEVYDALTEFTTDFSSEVLEMSQNYMNDPDHVEEMFDNYSSPAAQAMGQLNEITSAYVPEGV